MMSCARLTSSSWADILSKFVTENKGITRGFSQPVALRKIPLPLFRFGKKTTEDFSQRISMPLCQMFRVCSVPKNLFAPV